LEEAAGCLLFTLVFETKFEKNVVILFQKVFTANNPPKNPAASTCKIKLPVPGSRYAKVGFIEITKKKRAAISILLVFIRSDYIPI